MTVKNMNGVTMVHSALPNEVAKSCYAGEDRLVRE